MAAKKKITKPSPKKKPTAKSAKKKPAARRPASKTASKKPAAKGGRKAPTRKAPARTSKRPSTRSKVKAAPKGRVTRAPRAPPAEAPEALALARAIAAVATEKKALDVMVIDSRARSSSVGYDYVVLASGESDRQLAAIHEGVEALLKPQGRRAASVEASPDWVCVTYDEGVVAHFLTPEKRELVDFEELWQAAPRVTP